MGKNKYYCRINGIIENLKDVQDVLDGIDKEHQIEYLLINNHNFDPFDAILFVEVVEFNNNEIPVDFNECLERMRERNRRRVNSTAVHCPYCNSTNVNRISSTKKAMSIIGFGILSNKIGKQWHCNNCKSDF